MYFTQFAEPSRGENQPKKGKIQPVSELKERKRGKRWKQGEHRGKYGYILEKKQGEYGYILEKKQGTKLTSNFRIRGKTLITR